MSHVAMSHDVRRLPDGSIDYDAYRRAAAQLRHAARGAMVGRLFSILFHRGANSAAVERLLNKILDVGFLLISVFLFRSTKGRSHETQ